MILRKGMDVVVRLLGPLVLLALMMSVARVILDLWAVYRSPTISAGFDTLVTGILSTFVVMELLKSVVDYAQVHRLKITFIVDASAVFTLREVMIGLYRRDLGFREIGALASAGRRAPGGGRRRSGRAALPARGPRPPGRPGHSP